MPPASIGYNVRVSAAKLLALVVAERSARGRPMQQITDWLESLGLSEYAQRFAENDIDFSILADLTDQDLEKIGVTSLGHRRKILRAIAELGKATAVAPALAQPAPAPRP